MAPHFTPAERRALERALAVGDDRCPRCGATLERREIPPRTDVSYVRDRVWLLCGTCAGSAVLDRDRIDRGGGPCPPSP